MAFKGEVGQISLLNIFQALGLNQQDGILVVSHGRQKRKIRFFTSGIRLLSNYRGDPDPLKQILLRLKIINDSQFQNIISTKNDDQIPLGDFLIQRRIIDPALVESTIYLHILELIFDIFYWKQARYEFQAGGDAQGLEFFSPEGYGESLTFEIPSVLMEVAHREDEWKRIREVITSDNEIYVPASPGTFGSQKQHDSDVPPEAILEVKKLIDGERTVEAIVGEATSLPYEIYRTLQLLRAAGEIRPLSVIEKKSLAEKFRKKFKLKEAVGLYEYLLTIDAEDTETRLKLVGLLEKKKEYQTALVEHYRYLADHHAAKGEIGPSTNYLQRLLEIEPHSLGAKGMLFEIYSKGQNPRETLELARSMVDSIKITKDYAQGTALLKKVLEHFPDETYFYHELADFHQFNGKPAEAIRCLKTVAALYERRGDLTRVRKTYERISMIDPSESSYLRKIQDLEKRRSQPLWKTLAPVLITSLVISLICLAAYWAVIEVFSRQVFASVNQDVQVLIDTGNYNEAQEILATLNRVFPMSTVKWKIAARLNTIASRQREQTTKSQQEAEKENMLFGSFLAQVEKLRREKKYIEALKQIQGIRRVQLSAVNVKILEGIEADIQGVINDADAKLRKAKELIQEGQYEKAHALYLKLLMEFPNTPATVELKIPVVVRTVPSEAEVSLNGQKAGKSPLIIYYNPFEKLRLHMSKEGFRDFSCGGSDQEQPCIDFTRDWSFTVRLHRMPQWTFDTRGSIESAPTADSRRIYASNRNGKVFALKRETGEVQWSYSTPANSDIPGGLRVGAETVFFTTFNGWFVILDKNNGESRHELLPFRTESFSRTFTSEVSERGIACVLGSSQVAGIDIQTGSVVWSQALDALVDGAPVPYGNFFICWNTSGTIFFLDESKGTLNRSLSLKVPLSSPGVVFEDSLLIADNRGTAYRLNLKNGEIVWSYRTEIGNLPRPAVGFGQVFFVAEEGQILALDLQKGTRSWSLKVQDRLTAPGAAGRDLFYAASHGGILYAIDKDSGNLSWTFQAEGRLLPPPQLFSGQLIIGSDKNILYSFKTQ